VDDNASMRRTLRSLLESHDSWQVVGEASDGLEAVAKFDHGKKDVDAIVMDFQMPNMNGIEAAKRIAFLSPHTPILMITLHNSQQLSEQARRVGILGICDKGDIDCVVEGVIAILDNKPYFKN